MTKVWTLDDFIHMGDRYYCNDGSVTAFRCGGHSEAEAEAVATIATFGCGPLTCLVSAGLFAQIVRRLEALEAK